MSITDRLERLLGAVSLFQGFSQPELIELLKQSGLQETFHDEDVVFREGMPSSRMYVVLAGQFRITRGAGLEHEDVLAMLEPGECFGEMGLIDPSPRSARATAIGETTLLVVSEKALREASSSVSLKLYRNFASILAARLRVANEQLVRVTASERRNKLQVRSLTRRRSVERGGGLHGVDLHEADLRGSELRGADMRGAQLTGARLDHANLRECDMRGVDLRGAQFLDTDLRGANLSGADLRGAVFRGTNFETALFLGADTREVTVEEDLGASADDGRRE